jgi:hypothetical protein
VHGKTPRAGAQRCQNKGKPWGKEPKTKTKIKYERESEGVGSEREKVKRNEVSREQSDECCVKQ